MVVRVFIAIIASMLIGLLPQAAGAEAAIDKGLSISPLRSELSTKAGQTVKGSFTVANLTDKPMMVSFSVSQFSVTNFVYDYEFRTSDNDWVKIQVPQIELRPREGKKIPYAVSIPERTAPGGYYYTLFASTKIASGIPSTVQAASLLYMTVEGKLIRTSVLQNDSIPFIVTGNEVPYKFDIKNLGNVHFSAYFYGQLDTIFSKGAQVGTSHLVMPGLVRTIEGTIPSPLLPGVYKVTFGYKVDFANFLVTRVAYIVYIPPWSIIAVIFVLICAKWLWQKRRDRLNQGGV